MTVKLDRLSNIFLIIASALVSVQIGMGLVNQFRLKRPAGAAPAVENVKDQKLVATIDGRPSEGMLTAKVVLIEFSDFQCPFCAVYDRDVHPQIQSEYVSPGRVRSAFRHLPLASHQFALDAAVAAECAFEHGRFTAMRARLFGGQTALAPIELRAHALDVGLGEPEYVSCVGARSTLAKIRADQAEAQRLRVVSTPTFFVGMNQPDGRVSLLSKITGAQPYSVFKAALDAVIR